MSFPIQSWLPDFNLGENVFDLNGHDPFDQPSTPAAAKNHPPAQAVGSSMIAGTTTVSVPEASKASNGISALFSGLAALPLQVVHGAQWLFSTGPDAIQEGATLSTVSAVPAPRPSLYERNCAEIQTLLNEIDRVLRELDGELRSQDPRHQPVMPSSLQPAREQTNSEYARSWGYSLRGAAAAATSAMGRGAVAAGLPYVAGLTGNLFAQAAALLGGGYLGLTTVRDLPDQARQNAVNLAIRDAMQAVEERQRKLQPLVQHEAMRKNAMDRIVTVAAERRQRVQALETRLETLTAAMHRASAVPVTTPYANAAGRCMDSVNMGDGAQRQQSLSTLASAQQAFQELFTTVNASLSNAIGYGLSSASQTIHRVIAIPGALLDRYTAYRAEIAYQNGEGRSLIQTLSVPSEGASIVNVSYRNSQNQYREACGFAPPQAEVRNQLHIGQNIARALVISDDPTPGSVVFSGASGPKTVTSNLTTTRALAWYLDAAADHPKDIARDAAAPTVRRLPDNSLSIDDPQGHFYQFLMQAPTAYTVSMVDATEQHGTLEPGLFQLHDYYAGFPRGSRGVQFERTVDEKTGGFVLRMRLVNAPATFGIQPAIIPLRDDDHIANRMQTPRRVHHADHSILAASDYQNMSKEELATAHASVIAELTRHARLAQNEQQQLERLENWEHPDFRQRVV
ncbi:hypothetical protein [Bordetella muralis]|uniref:hypothetical protein n=1 Tax=Bordetella muralis TaxID=1649130 RepID=UPI0039EF7450